MRQVHEARKIRTMLTVTLYSRPGCCLCEEMEAIVRAVQKDRRNEIPEIPFQIEKIDISTDPELNSRFSLEIPVLYINGQFAFMYELRADELRQRLAHARKDA
jgi:glutaredoxin